MALETEAWRLLAGLGLVVAGLWLFIGDMQELRRQPADFTFWALIDTLSYGRPLMLISLGVIVVGAALLASATIEIFGGHGWTSAWEPSVRRAVDWLLDLL